MEDKSGIVRWGFIKHMELLLQHGGLAHIVKRDWHTSIGGRAAEVNQGGDVPDCYINQQKQWEYMGKEDACGGVQAMRGRARIQRSNSSRL